uniref:Uncharacterized protein n=1 Tax=Timema genevievae TaxID=629358 RepID=A0A7R9K6L7_TIMGE|nr:unnamed protein product [Timema genevievae]
MYKRKRNTSLGTPLVSSIQIENHIREDEDNLEILPSNVPKRKSSLGKGPSAKTQATNKSDVLETLNILRSSSKPSPEKSCDPKSQLVLSRNVISVTPKSSTKDKTARTQDRNNEWNLKRTRNPNCIKHYFKEVLKEAGLVFSDGDGPHLLDVKQALFINEVEKLLTDISARCTNNIERFLNELKDYCKDKNILLKSLEPTHWVTPKTLDGELLSPQDSLIHMLLTIKCVQPGLIEFLFHKIAELGMGRHRNNCQYTRLGSNYDPPVIDVLVYCEGDALDNETTKAGNSSLWWQPGLTRFSRVGLDCQRRGGQGSIPFGINLGTAGWACLFQSVTLTLDWTADDGEIGKTDKEISWVQLILKQLKFIGPVVKPLELNEWYFQLLEGVPHNVQVDMIILFQDIVDSEYHEECAKKFQAMLREYHQLIPALLEMLRSLDISPELQGELTQQMLKILPSVPMENLPTLVTFLQVNTSAPDLPQVVHALRKHLNFYPEDRKNAKQYAEQVNYQLLTAESLQESMLNSEPLVTAWLKLVEEAADTSEHNPMDVIMLLLLYSTSSRENKKLARKVFSSKVRTGTFTSKLLRAVFERHSSIVEKLCVEHLDSSSCQQVVSELLLLVVQDNGHSETFLTLLNEIPVSKLALQCLGVMLANAIVVLSSTAEDGEIKVRISVGFKLKGVISSVVVAKNVIIDDESSYTATSNKDVLETSTGEIVTLTPRASHAKSFLDLDSKLCVNKKIEGSYYEDMSSALISIRKQDADKTFLVSEEFESAYVNDIEDIKLGEELSLQFHLDSNATNTICIQIGNIVEKEMKTSSSK